MTDAPKNRLAELRQASGESIRDLCAYLSPMLTPEQREKWPERIKGWEAGGEIPEPYVQKIAHHYGVTPAFVLRQERNLPRTDQIEAAAKIVRDLSLVHSKMATGWASFDRDSLAFEGWADQDHRDHDPSQYVEVKIPGYEMGTVDDPEATRQFEFCELAVRYAVDWFEVFNREDEKAEVA